MIFLNDNDIGPVRINPRYVITVKLTHDEGGRHKLRVSTHDWNYYEDFLPSQLQDAENRLLEVIAEVDRSNKPEDRI